MHLGLKYVQGQTLYSYCIYMCEVKDAMCCFQKSCLSFTFFLFLGWMKIFKAW